MDESPIMAENPESEGAEPIEQAEGIENASALPNASESGQEQLLPQLLQEIQDLRQEFVAKLKYDASKERQVGSLYQELQAHKEVLHFKILKPMFIDLIGMHDDLDKLAERLVVDDPEAVSSTMYSNLKSFQETIEETLKRHGVELFSSEGETYVPGKQRILRVVDTPRIEEDKQIARRVRQGFSYDERVLRQELVHVYRFVREVQ